MPARRPPTRHRGPPTDLSAYPVPGVCCPVVEEDYVLSPGRRRSRDGLPAKERSRTSPIWCVPCTRWPALLRARPKVGGSSAGAPGRRRPLPAVGPDRAGTQVLQQMSTGATPRPSLNPSERPRGQSNRLGVPEPGSATSVSQPPGGGGPTYLRSPLPPAEARGFNHRIPGTARSPGPRSTTTRPARGRAREVRVRGELPRRRRGAGPRSTVAAGRGVHHDRVRLREPAVDDIHRSVRGHRSEKIGGLLPSRTSPAGRPSGGKRLRPPSNPPPVGPCRACRPSRVEEVTSITTSIIMIS